MDSIIQLRFLPTFEEKPLFINANPDISLEKVFSFVSKEYGFPSEHLLRFLDTSSGARIYGNSSLTAGSYFENCLSQPRIAEFEVYREISAGKGGFGSMLRTIGAQIEKTTNREACRDLSGRRMRDVEREKRIRAAAIKKSKTKIENMAKKKDAAKKKLENLMNNPGSSKETILNEEPLIITDISDKIDEDLAYFQASSSKVLDSTPPETNIEVQSVEIIEEVPEIPKESSEVQEPVPETDSGKTDKKDSSDDSDDSDDDDKTLGKNFWSGI